MGFEDAGIEKLKGSSSTGNVSKMSLSQAINFGEYDPAYLATFAEWHTLSKHIQFQYIRKALDNRERQLRVQWAEIVNFLDFSKKPHLKDALENIQKQMKIVEKDREKLYLEYSK